MNTEKDRDRERASSQVSWALRNLTANLIRIMRGAGKPFEIGEQVTDLIDALVAYQKATGHWPLGHEVSEMLSFGQIDSLSDEISEANRLHFYAEQRIIRGALQQAASRLIGQTTQERAGESEMHSGIRDLEDARVRMRQELVQQGDARKAVLRLTTKPKRTKKPG